MTSNVNEVNIENCTSVQQMCDTLTVVDTLNVFTLTRRGRNIFSHYCNKVVVFLCACTCFQYFYLYMCTEVMTWDSPPVRSEDASWVRGETFSRN